jgi:hypothetical protein
MILLVRIVTWDQNKSGEDVFVKNHFELVVCVKPLSLQLLKILVLDKCS